jgi:hypothetical protein
LKEIFFKFFQKRILGSECIHWTLEQRMPRSRIDEEFDELIAQHRIERKHASCFWREFKSSKGVVKIKITKSKRELLADFHRRLDATRLVDNVLDSVRGYDFDFDHEDQETTDFFHSLMHSNGFAQTVGNYALQLNVHLSERLSGATLLSISIS